MKRPKHACCVVAAECACGRISSQHSNKQMDGNYEISGTLNFPRRNTQSRTQFVVLQISTTMTCMTHLAFTLVSPDAFPATPRYFAERYFARGGVAPAGSSSAHVRSITAVRLVAAWAMKMRLSLFLFVVTSVVHALAKRLEGTHQIDRDVAHGIADRGHLGEGRVDVSQIDQMAASLLPIKWTNQIGR